MKLRLLGVVAAVMLLGADTTEGVKKELEKFEGTWKYVSVEAEGMSLPADLLKNSSIKLKGDKFIATEANMITHGTFKVEPNKKPKSLDVTFTDGPDKGKTLLGIYELEGDVYKVCIGMPGKDRPKEFVSKAGSGHVLEVFNRVKE